MLHFSPVKQSKLADLLDNLIDYGFSSSSRIYQSFILSSRIVKYHTDYIPSALSFAIQYLIECLVPYLPNLLTDSDVFKWREFIRYVSEDRTPRELKILESVFQRLICRAKIVSHLLEEFVEISDSFAKDPAFRNARKIPNGCAITRKVHISPLKVTLIPPLIEQSNRFCFTSRDVELL